MSKKVVILGGGSGGISVAAKLQREAGGDVQITIVDPAETHYYQPLWTLAGAGIRTMQETAKPMAELIPAGVEWVKAKVQSVDPVVQKVLLQNGSVLAYDALIVATGLELNWSAIKGLEGQLGKNGICSIYDRDTVEKTNQMIRSLKNGKALFIMPPVPIKCAGAPQKIMYLAEEIFRENGVREKVSVHFYTFGKAMFGIPVFADALKKVVQRKNIETHFLHKLVEVKPEKKIAVFSLMKEAVVEGCGSKPGAAPDLVETEKVEVTYDLLHVVPPMKASDWVKDSGLVFSEGPQKNWLEVDMFTLQHLRYPNIFGIGDVVGVPNSKTGAAVRAMYPVVVKNLLSFLKGQPLTATYNGYSSCPLITQKGRVILAEFGYDSKLLPTFPLNPAIERLSMWILKAYFLPIAYWKGMMKGRF